MPHLPISSRHTRTNAYRRLILSTTALTLAFSMAAAAHVLAADTTIASGNTLTVNDQADIGSTTDTTTVQDGGTLEITGNTAVQQSLYTISGDGNGGIGAINSSGNNTLSGNIVFNGSTTITSAAGLLTLDGDISGAVGPHVPLSMGGDGDILSSGDIVVGSAGQSDNFFKVGNGKLTLTGTNNAFTGFVDIQGGTLEVSGGGTVTIDLSDPADLTQVDANLLVTGAGSTFTNNDYLVVGRGAGPTSVTVDNGGHVNTYASQIGEGIGFAQSNQITAKVDGAGSVWNLGSGGANVGAAAGSTASLTISNGGVMESTAGGAISIGRGGDGTATVTDAGSRLQTDYSMSVGELFNGNAGTGTLDIENGGLAAAGEAHIGVGSTGTVTVHTGSQLQAGNFLGVGEAASDYTGTQRTGQGNLTIEAGALASASDVWVGVDNGVISGSSGTLAVLGTPGARGVLETTSLMKGNDSATALFDGGILRATGNTADNGYGNPFIGSYLGTFTVNIGAGGMFIDSNGFDVTASAVLDGTGPLTKDGAGILTLTGDNAYDGPTTVNTGTLRVNGDQSGATGLTSVVSGATLGGSGTIGGDVDIADGGILAPGNSPGTLTINGDLSLSGASLLDYEFGQANIPGGAFNDLTLVHGNLTLDGSIDVSVPAGGSFGVGIYRVIGYDGTLTNNILDLGTMPAGSNVVVQTSVANQVNLVNQATSTLSFWDGDAGPKDNGIINGGDGSWHLGDTDNNWTDETGATNAPYADGTFAVFAAIPGTVTVDNGAGTVTASGMQFASDGYVLTGDPLTLAGTQSTIRVGDGTEAGANYTATIESELTGTSDLVKTDLGNLVLAGNNSYTGATDVEAGTLTVNGSIANSAVLVQSSATLSGSGTVGATTVAPGGTIAPGNGLGTISVNGNYTQQAGSAYKADIDPTSAASDRINVSGAATLADGATINVAKTTRRSYSLSTRYTVLSATGGLRGTFDLTGETDLTALIHLIGDYDANNAYLVTEQSRTIGSIGDTPNQISTGEGVDSLPSSNPVKAPILNLPDEAAVRGALDQLSGEIHASVKTAAIEQSHFVRDAATDRMREAFCGVAATATTHRQETNEDDRRRSPSSRDCGAASDRPVAWGRAFGSWGHRDSDGNAAKLNRSTGGFIAGGDAAVFDTWRFGVLAGYSGSSTRIDDRHSSATSDEYHVGIYGGSQWGRLGLRTGATYTSQNISTSRSMNFSGFSDRLFSDYHAGATQIFTDLGYRIDADELALEPFVNLAYLNLDTDGFTEHGGTAALTGQGNSTNTFFTTIGVRASTTLELGGAKVLARSSLGWRHAFADTVPVSTLAFNGGSPFDISGAPIARDAMIVNAGLDFNISKDATLGISYDGQFASGSIDQSVGGTFSVRF